MSRLNPVITMARAYQDLGSGAYVIALSPADSIKSMSMMCSCMKSLSGAALVDVIGKGEYAFPLISAELQI